MAKVLINIDEQGDVQVKVEGVAGPGCKDLTKQIERALGEVTSDKPTAEYSAVQQRKAVQR